MWIIFRAVIDAVFLMGEKAGAFKEGFQKFKEWRQNEGYEKSLVFTF